MDCISHHSLHSHIPIHHYTNHTAVTNHSLALIVSPHLHLIHTHTFKQHSYMHSPRSLVLAPADISKRYSSCYLLLLCLTPDCLTLELWTRACDPDFCLVLFTSLPCLWYSCFCPLTFACLILSIKHLTALGSTRLWPVITVILTASEVQNIRESHFPPSPLPQTQHSHGLPDWWVDLSAFWYTFNHGVF